MTRIVTAREANQHFSEILGRATDGEAVIITRRGEPVAQLIPYASKLLDETRAGAWDRLLAQLESGISLGGGKFDREALYDR